MPSPTASPQAVIEAYVEGTRNRDVALLKQTFHDDAVMTGWFGTHLGISGPEPFYKELEENEVGDDYAATIVSVEQTDRIALAELTEANLLGVSFTNHFHLVQMEDDSWRIISKLFRHY